jgi:hypothetical protein
MDLVSIMAIDGTSRQRLLDRPKTRSGAVLGIGNGP